MTPTEQIQFENAKKRVKQIKNFYIHLLVYIIINTAILIMKYSELQPNEPFFVSENLSLTIFWGIGLISHAINVFGLNVILGSKWEEKKIEEILKK